MGCGPIGSPVEEIVVAGGTAGREDLTTVEIFNIATSTWRAGGPHRIQCHKIFLNLIYFQAANNLGRPFKFGAAIPYEQTFLLIGGGKPYRDIDVIRS